MGCFHIKASAAAVIRCCFSWPEVSLKVYTLSPPLSLHTMYDNNKGDTFVCLARIHCNEQEGSGNQMNKELHLSGSVPPLTTPTKSTNMLGVFRIDKVL